MNDSDTESSPKIPLTGNPVLDQAPKNYQVLADEEMQYFISEKSIAPEDQEVIAALATVHPDEVVLLYHNFFSFHRHSANPNSAIAAIQRQRDANQTRLESAQASQDAKQEELYRQRLLLDNGLLRLTEIYGPATALAVASRLEELEPNP